MTLAEAKAGTTVTVTEINCGAESKRRLIDIGLIKGAEIRVIRSAPLGDPIQIGIKDFSLALRKSDARRISVRPERGDQTE